MINAPDPLVLGDKRRNIKLIYEKDGDKHTPIWKLEGISNREQRLIADLNIDDLAGVAAGERFGEGFAYVLANPLTDPAQISEQRKVMDVDHPFDTLDGIVDAMYALGHHMEMLDSSSFKDENKIAHRLKFLGAYVGLLACLKANFKDSDAQPLASIGAYAEEVLNTVPFLQLPDVARATEKFFRVTFEVTEPIVGQGEPKILRAEYIGHRINPVEMMRELGHRIKASFNHYGRSYTSQVLALIDTIVKDAIAPAQETLSILPA